MPHVNLYFAWVWILMGVASGTSIGLFFHEEQWLGGYGSWRRRMVRLGHISFLGTGLLNLAFVFTISYGDIRPAPFIASWLFVVGGLSMPSVCFLAAWNKGWSRLFVIPVVALLVAVLDVVLEGLP